MPEPASARIWRESLPSIVAAFIMSSVGGGLGIYVGYSLLEYRMAELEKATERLDAYNRVQDERLDTYKAEIRPILTEIKSDVSYIRGKIERGN